jgi:hypothetical protein
LSQADRAPLCRIKRLKKLECFNRGRFKELKDRFKEINFVYYLKKKKRLKKEEKKVEERVIYDDIKIQRDILCIGYKDREEEWIGKEKWDMVIDFENYWGDLSIDEEEKLSRLLKGKDNIIL